MLSSACLLKDATHLRAGSSYALCERKALLGMRFIAKCRRHAGQLIPEEAIACAHDGKWLARPIARPVVLKTVDIQQASLTAIARTHLPPPSLHATARTSARPSMWPSDLSVRMSHTVTASLLAPTTQSAPALYATCAIPCALITLEGLMVRTSYTASLGKEETLGIMQSAKHEDDTRNLLPNIALTYPWLPADTSTEVFPALAIMSLATVPLVVMCPVSRAACRSYARRVESATMARQSAYSQRSVAS